MATEKTDFLKFNAYSMKELITRKMSEDSNFTDQIYEGSNLAILIDLVSYMYQVLVYQLNNAAAESMFSDTQIYENISRLVKLIGYNPKGFIPAQMQVNIYRDEENNQPMTLLKYSSIDTGLVDSRGESIYFSVPGENGVEQGGSIDIESETIRTVNLVNGKWKRYPQVLVASGTEFETFTLDDLKSDSNLKKYVADGFIDIYIKRGGEFGNYFQFKMDKNELLMGMSKNSDSRENTANRVYNSSSKVFSLRLNENKVYEIKFGDGTTCEKLNRGDQIYIFYLDSNGPEGEIDIGSVDFTSLKFKHSASEFGLASDDYNKIFGIGTKILLTNQNEQSAYNLSPYTLNTTKSFKEQDVEEIKTYAPQWFKTGNRLITRLDYEFFTKSTVPQIIDVKCMNNWEYLTTFHKWLYDCGVRYHQNYENPGRYYFNSNRFLRNGFPEIDASDSNNIYLWIQPSEGTTLEQITYNLKTANIEYIKTMTAELQYIKPIQVKFDVCAAYQDVAKVYSDNGQFDEFVQNAVNDSYIEITLDENCLYVNTYIFDMVRQIFQKYFKIENLKIGQNINISDILNDIYSIGGISRVRTVFQPTQGMYSLVDKQQSAPRALDGISLISWTDGILDYGEDVQIGNVTRHIQNFQFPSFNGKLTDSMYPRIKVIKKQLNSIGNIKY